jgi:hypothetical protein
MCSIEIKEQQLAAATWAHPHAGGQNLSSPRFAIDGVSAGPQLTRDAQFVA